jgi:SHOCT-like domain
MSTTEERMRILKMVSDKQITAEEGAKLLEALRAGQSAAQDMVEPNKSRWLRVRVTDRATGKSKVNVNIPAGLLDVGLKMGARFAPNTAGMDLQAVQAAMKEGMQGKIVDVDDEEHNERVEIFLE